VKQYPGKWLVNTCVYSGWLKSKPLATLSQTSAVHLLTTSSNDDWEFFDWQTQQ